jgi:hypothetical protein
MASHKFSFVQEMLVSVLKAHMAIRIPALLTFATPLMSRLRKLKVTLELVLVQEHLFHATIDALQEVELGNAKQWIP